MEIKIEPLTPLFTHGEGEQHTEKRVNKQGRTSTIPSTKPRHFYRLNDTLYIPTTGLKGPLRAVAETVSNGCISLISEGYYQDRGRKQIKALDDTAMPDGYQNCGVSSSGLKAGHICQACAIFGVTPGDGDVEQMALAGRVLLSGAQAKTPVKSSDRKWTKLPLPIGTAPKPRHVAFYRELVKGQPGQILGRKFYFHHQDYNDTLALYKNASMPIEAVTCPFSFEIQFHNLTESELKLLVYTLELEADLAHHIGYGRSFGLGSARLSIVQAKIFGPALTNPKERFLSYTASAEDEEDLPELSTALRQQFDTWQSSVATEWKSRSPDAYAAFRQLFAYPGANLYQYPPYNWFKPENASTTLSQYPQGRPKKAATTQSTSTSAPSSLSSSGRQRGRIQQFDSDKTYGFIEVPGQRRGLFVHINNVRGRVRLRPGQEVEYSVGPGREGRDQATDVEPL
jgi:cold shock CspA family protein